MWTNQSVASVWNGITRSATLSDGAASVRRELADHAKRYDWPAVFAILEAEPDLANSWRPGGQSLYTPLHQAAHGGAPASIVQRLIRTGAWRALRAANGERAIDIAQRRDHTNLVPLLQPAWTTVFDESLLTAIQARLHELIRVRAGELIDEHALRLPELEVLLELEAPEIWFPVPGMYGGFKLRLMMANSEPRLISDSWCRVVGGSGQRHEITADRVVMTDEGFV